MNARKWVISFAVTIIALMTTFMAVNYSMDSVEYFAVEKNKSRWGILSYFRASKIKHLDKYSEKYTGIVVGGSKSGTVDTERLASYTGDNWYNLCVNSPTVHEYYLYVKWLIENTNMEKLCLYLSGHEVNRQWDEDSVESITKTTEIVIGKEKDIIQEYLYYLTLDIETNREYYKNTREYNDRYHYDAMSGMIEYTMYNGIGDKVELEDYVQKNVYKQYQNDLKILFEGNKSIVSASENVRDLKKIVALCEEHDIEMMVILGPTFLGELKTYECQEFYTYLRNLVNVINIWDFSGINDINMNPYNFINTTHCNYSVNNLVLDTVYYGKQIKEGFGILLTEDNIDEYLKNRQKTYEELKQEYEENGTVELNGLDGAGYLN